MAEAALKVPLPRHTQCPTDRQYGAPQGRVDKQVNHGDDQVHTEHNHDQLAAPAKAAELVHRQPGGGCTDRGVSRDGPAGSGPACGLPILLADVAERTSFTAALSIQAVGHPRAEEGADHQPTDQREGHTAGAVGLG